MARPETHKQLLLLLCLSLPVLLFLRMQVNITTGHMDEYDYLFVGKTLLGGGHWPTHTYIFGWDINWLLLAWGDTVFGGLHGGRIVAAGFGVVSLAAMYAFVYGLWKSHTTAFIAALLLGFEAAHLYTSALATYDILSFAAFTCALPCILLVCQSSGKPLLWTVCSCIALSIAVLSKYTAVIYLPFIAVLVLWRSPRYALIGMLLITAMLICYAALNFDQLKVLYEIQIQRTHSANATLPDILKRTSRQLWIVCIFAGLGLIHSLIYPRINRRIDTLKILLLIVFSAPLLVYHLVSQNIISLQKHLVYSSLFLIPIMAWWLHEFYTKNSQSNTRAALVLVCSYPNISEVDSIVSQVDATATILSEDPYLFRYLLFDSVEQSQIYETTWLDNNRDGKHERRDVREAIWDRKFDYVFLNDQQNQNFNAPLREMLLLRNYEPVLNKNYELETMSGKHRYGVISLHRKNDVPNEELSTRHANQSLM